MAYFDGIKVGDKVWDFIFRRRGKVIHLGEDDFIVEFDNNLTWSYDYNGVLYGLKDAKQTLFWDEIEFKVSEKHKIKLKEDKYLIDFSNCKVSKNKPIGCEDKIGLLRSDKETAEKALKAIKRFTRLLALRDQECPDSRGYEFIKGIPNYFIVKIDGQYCVDNFINICCPTIVYFKTKEDAQKICNILNSRRFDLKGEKNEKN